MKCLECGSEDHEACGLIGYDGGALDMAPRPTGALKPSHPPKSPPTTGFEAPTHEDWAS